jgi:hypothetical protein
MDCFLEIQKAVTTMVAVSPVSLVSIHLVASVACLLDKTRILYYLIIVDLIIFISNDNVKSLHVAAAGKINT